MFIRELAEKSGLTATTIRYYESIGLIPPPQRAENNYRHYTEADVERLRFIASARSLGFNLEEITEFLAARDDGLLPCQRVLDSLDQHLAEIEQRIADLLALRETLISIRQEAKALPQAQVRGEECICYLLTLNRQNGQITIQQEDKQMLTQDRLENNGLPAFVCDLNALEPEQREEHRCTAEQVFAAVTEIRELADGYAFRLPQEQDMLLRAAQFINYERLCCPFFSFALEIEPHGGPLWLKLTGREGIKPFIQAEILSFVESHKQNL